jgi:hypothetical protein
MVEAVELVAFLLRTVLLLLTLVVELFGQLPWPLHIRRHV